LLLMYLKVPSWYKSRGQNIIFRTFTRNL
jgi:hypothetical protein